MDKNKLFQSLFKTYVLAHPTKMKQQCQDDLIIKWNEIKNEEDLEIKVEQLIKDLNAIIMKNKGTLFSYWAKQTTTVKKNEAISLGPTAPFFSL